MEKQKFYITTAIAYASRKPHFGNTYEIIMADAYARLQRQLGKDVFLCTGTDEHGQKIENLANEAGITPKAYVDGVAGEIRGIWDLMGASYDRFIRTTDEDHVRTVKKIFRRFYEQGDIYKGYYEGWSETFRKWWPADVHIIGKDILRFHTIYWPIFLMALGLPLPEKVFGHPWFNVAEEKKDRAAQAEVKMSKSRGNVIYADDLARVFGVDGVRYFALSEMPYDQDGRICWTNVLNRYNTDLANNLGNLVSRTHAMTVKYFDGIVPAPGTVEAVDGELQAAVHAALEKAPSLGQDLHLADALEEIFSMLRRANKYIDQTTPWLLAKDPACKARLGTVLYNLLESVRVAAVLLNPYIPTSAATILEQLGTDKTDAAFGALEAGKPLGTAHTLFARVEDKVVDDIIRRNEEEAEKAAKAALQTQDPGDHAGIIHIDQFAAVELRTAQILSAEKVAKAKKLLCLQVDLGYEKRQIVSGIAKFYTPEELVGKKIVVVANLAPATLCGMESQGMLLASGEEQVRVIFLDPETPLGERVH